MNAGIIPNLILLGVTNWKGAFTVKVALFANTLLKSKIKTVSFTSKNPGNIWGGYVYAVIEMLGELINTGNNELVV